MMRSFLRADFIQDQADGLNYVEICAFVAAADIIGFTWPPFSKDKVKRSGVILDIEPVADIGAFPIDRKRLTLQGIENHQLIDIDHLHIRPLDQMPAHGRADETCSSGN